jgi:hypothetical protein
MTSMRPTAPRRGPRPEADRCPGAQGPACPSVRDGGGGETGPRLQRRRQPPGHEPRDRDPAGLDPAVRRCAVSGPGRRRVGGGKGACRSTPSRREPAGAPAVFVRQLCRLHARAPGNAALRPQPRGLHRCRRRPPGILEEAGRGSLFLDEVGELPALLQSKLLRVLENGEYYRLGETHNRRAECRVITATNRDLGDGVRRGTFRQDLYHRLSVLSIAVPPLREPSPRGSGATSMRHSSWAMET